MNPIYPLVFMAFAATALEAQTVPLVTPAPIIAAADVDNLSDFKWVKRPLIIFSDSPANPDFIRQMDLLDKGLADLGERDVVVITDADPDAQTALRETLRPRGFALVLIGKDGGVKLRKPLPWDVREISRSIDKMPMRQEEMKR